MAEDQTSLHRLFKQARSQQDRLDELDSRSDDYRQVLNTARRSLRQCRDLIDRLALFSKNEDLDDLSTQDLQYLTLDYYLAELNMKSYENDRNAQLKEAANDYETFLGRLEEYSILGGNDARLLRRYREDRQHFSLTGNAGMEARRNLKLARFQEEKSLKDHLRRLRDQSQSSDVDDEIVRSLYLAEINFAVHQAFQALDLISQEMAILASMPHPDPSRHDHSHATADQRRADQSVDGYSDRLDVAGLGRPGKGPLLDPRGRPLQPFTLTDKRTQLRQGVFRPDHSLPTMSIEEYLEEEHKRGGIVQGGNNAEPPRPDEDDLDAADAATMKAREWDEFVEANPKGSGNTINRG